MGNDDSKGAGEAQPLGIIICSRGRRTKPCATPGCGRPSVALCDYPVTRDGKAATCDRPMCGGCRHRVDRRRDVDYCRAHAELARAAK